MSKCPHADTEKGPRYPLRWGSAPTEVCRSCGAFRLTAQWLSKWRDGPVSDAVQRAHEAGADL